MEQDIRIRIASEADTEQILAVYAPYVEHTAITFEYEVPSAEEFSGRIRHVLQKYPYLAAEAGGEILGYAYVGAFNPRAAYDWAAETSIYVKMDQKRHGIGSRLYRSLENILREQGILNLNACIGYPEAEDEYLTWDSVKFHTKMGYRMVGEFQKCGYKFGRWYDMVWMEKQIGEHPAHPAPVRAFAEIRPLIAEKYSISG